jgi:phosphonate transport system substrate-binding protein
VVKRDDIAIVWTSDPIPGSPFCMRRDLPTDLKKRIREAFYQMRDLAWGLEGHAQALGADRRSRL